MKIDRSMMIGLLDNEISYNNFFGLFWDKLSQSDKNNIYKYCQIRKGIISTSHDDENSILMEIVSELAEITLEWEYRIPRKEMYKDQGLFYEKYQDRFNALYDEIENRLLTQDIEVKRTSVKIKDRRVKLIEGKFYVKKTSFVTYEQAKHYAIFLSIVLKNKGKLIYVSSVEEAIRMHNQEEGKSNDEWLKICWGRNLHRFLHTKNIYALNF